MTRISHKCTYIPSVLNLPPTPLDCHRVPGWAPWKPLTLYYILGIRFFPLFAPLFYSSQTSAPTCSTGENRGQAKTWETALGHVASLGGTRSSLTFRSFGWPPRPDPEVVWLEQGERGSEKPTQGTATVCTSVGRTCTLSVQCLWNGSVSAETGRGVEGARAGSLASVAAGLVCLPALCPQPVVGGGPSGQVLRMHGGWGSSESWGAPGEGTRASLAKPCKSKTSRPSGQGNCILIPSSFLSSKSNEALLKADSWDFSGMTEVFHILMWALATRRHITVKTYCTVHLRLVAFFHMKFIPNVCLFFLSV